MTETVLIADDEAHIRLLIEQSLEELEDYDVEIHTADNGEDALAFIAANRPRLVILDVMMPRMSGFDVCEKVKNDPDLAATHVILLTAKGQEYDRQRGTEVGANLYMTKPFDSDHLLAMACDILGVGD